MKWLILTYPIFFIISMTSLYVMVATMLRNPVPIVKHVSHKPHPTATPSPTPTAKTRDVIVGYIKEKFGSEASTAIAIANEHNAMDCRYGHGTDHLGLFAIDKNDPRAIDADLLSCEQNIDVAYIIWKEEGFAPWGR